MKEKVLWIDDDAQLLAGMRRNLRAEFEVDVALSGPEGLDQLEKGGPYAVIVADMQMPRMNGLEFLSRAMLRSPESVRLMLTGDANQREAIDAVNQGQLFQFLEKPCAPEALLVALRGAVSQHRLLRAERELIEDTLNGSVRLLTDVLALVDPASFGRSQMVRDLAVRVAPRLGVRSRWRLELAAMLSQIGVVSLPPPVSERLRVGAELGEEDSLWLRRVPEISSQLLANIPRLTEVARIVRYQRKNFDGSGFPEDAVAGAAIPLESRILRILLDAVAAHVEGVDYADFLARLPEDQSVYDPGLVTALIQEFAQDAAAGAVTSSEQEVELPWEQLAVGMELRRDVRGGDGQLIASRGTRITALLLSKLRAVAELEGVPPVLCVRPPPAGA